MSVVVFARFPIADMARVRQVMDARAAELEEITADSRGLGALHHRFVASESELVVVDEWESAEAFQGFFQNNERIAAIAAEAGAQGPPSVEIYAPFEAAGTF